MAKKKTEHTAEEKESHEKKSKGVDWKLIGGAAILIAVLVILFTQGMPIKEDTPLPITVSTENNPEPATTKGAVLTIVNDQRCGSACNTAQLENDLKGIFPDVTIKTVDYGTAEGKAMYEDLGLQALPALLFSEEIKDAEGWSQIAQYTAAAGDYLQLRIRASFDPTKEICTNGKDDTGNGLVDCEDPTCSAEWTCMDKMEVPKVELFVMSHCPYGTQIEKGIIPVLDLLGDKIDFELKFCDYAMHMEKELDEQLAQYCIQKEEEDKLIPYLKCFLKAGDGASCITEAGVDQAKLNACVAATDSEFKVKANFADKTTYKGQFPTFNIFKEEVAKYGVAGSPTLVINGVKASSGRDPSSLLNAICYGFEDKPAECSESISSAAPSPGFGYSESASGASSDAQCG